MMQTSGKTPPHLGGLVLAGRRVVVVGGGTRAQRCLPGLLEAEARVEVIAPELTPAVQDLVDSGRVNWQARGYRWGDLAEAWLIVVCTAAQGVGTLVSRHAERQQTFWIDGVGTRAGSCLPLQTGEYDGMIVGVWGQPTQARRAARIRTSLMDALQVGNVPDHADGTAPAGVALVGGGPGDPELLTVRGRRLLARADVVVVDRLAPREVLAGLAPEVEVVDASKIPYGRALAQEKINELLVARARQGCFVVRLKGGDPFLYGRGYEEVIACSEAGVPVIVVPGVTSAIAAPAAAGVPVSHRRVAHEVVIVSAHVPPDDPGCLVNWPALAALRGTVVLLMAVLNIGAVAAALIRHGRDADTPVLVVQDATSRIQRSLRARLDTVEREIQAHEIHPPAVIVVGQVAGLAPDTQSWMEAAARPGRVREHPPADDATAAR